MPRKRPTESPPPEVPETDSESLDFVWSVWVHLTPAERLRRSWALRKRLRDPQAVHDAKLFPQP